MLGLYAISRRRAAGRGSTNEGSRVSGSTSTADIALVGLPFAIAVGSALYHAWPTPATQLADLVPIALFVSLAIALALDRVLHLARSVRVATLLVWFVATLVCARFPHILHGSLLYLPTLALLAALGPIARRTGAAPPGAARLLVATAVTFALALAARTADLPLCPRPPTGTHPLWHMLAAAAGGFAVHLLLPARRVTALSHRH